MQDPSNGQGGAPWPPGRGPKGGGGGGGAAGGDRAAPNRAPHKFNRPQRNNNSTLALMREGQAGGSIGDLLREKGRTTTLPERRKETGDQARSFPVPCSCWAWNELYGMNGAMCTNSNRDKARCAEGMLHMTTEELHEWHEELQKPYNKNRPARTLAAQPTKKILVLGDSSFEVSVGLTNSYPGSTLRLVATTFQGREEAQKKPLLSNNMAQLRQCGVLGFGFGIVPTEEGVRTIERTFGKFDIIVYNRALSGTFFDLAPTENARKIWLASAHRHPSEPHFIFTEVKEAVTYSVLSVFRHALEKDGLIQIVNRSVEMASFHQKYHIPEHSKVPFDYLSLPMYYPTRDTGRHDLHVVTYTKAALDKKEPPMPPKGGVEVVLPPEVEAQMVAIEKVRRERQADQAEARKLLGAAVADSLMKDKEGNEENEERAMEARVLKDVPHRDGPLPEGFYDEIYKVFSNAKVLVEKMAQTPGGLSSLSMVPISAEFMEGGASKPSLGSFEGSVEDETAALRERIARRKRKAASDAVAAAAPNAAKRFRAR